MKSTFIFLVRAALVDFQGQLHGNVEYHPHNQNPGGPPGDHDLPKVHTDEYLRNWTSKHCVRIRAEFSMLHYLDKPQKKHVMNLESYYVLNKNRLLQIDVWVREW